MKKIKSVKLKNDELKKGAWGNWLFPNCDFPVFSEEQITGNPSAFEIEYEEERKYIDVRIEFENDEYDDSWKPAMIRDIERTLNNNFIMTKKFKIIELAEGIL